MNRDKKYVYLDENSEEWTHYKGYGDRRQK
jgi:hypothetical protein